MISKMKSSFPLLCLWAAAPVLPMLLVSGGCGGGGGNRNSPTPTPTQISLPPREYPTLTPDPNATAIPIPTSTATPVSTATPMNTPTPFATRTPVATLPPFLGDEPLTSTGEYTPDLTLVGNCLGKNGGDRLRIICGTARGNLDVGISSFTEGQTLPAMGISPNGVPNFSGVSYVESANPPQTLSLQNWQASGGSVTLIQYSPGAIGNGGHLRMRLNNVQMTPSGSNATGFKGTFVLNGVVVAKTGSF